MTLEQKLDALISLSDANSEPLFMALVECAQTLNTYRKLNGEPMDKGLAGASLTKVEHALDSIGGEQ